MISIAVRDRLARAVAERKHLVARGRGVEGERQRDAERRHAEVADVGDEAGPGELVVADPGLAQAAQHLRVRLAGGDVAIVGRREPGGLLQTRARRRP